MTTMDPASRSSRFVFDRVFAEQPFNGDSLLSDMASADAADDSRPIFTAADLENARQQGIEEGLRQGREEGVAEGKSAAISETEAKVNSAFEALAFELARLVARHDEDYHALAHDCERLIHVVLDRVLPELVRRGGAEEIIGVVRTALSIACNDPVVEVRVPHDVVEGIRPRLVRLTRDVGFRGRVDLTGDSFLTEGMVRVRWLHGGAQRDPNQMQAEVSAIIERMLNRDDAQGSAPTEETVVAIENDTTEN